MNQKFVVNITDEEKNEMVTYFENLNAVKGLLLTLTESDLNIDENNYFYKKMKSDLLKYSKSYKSLWNNMVKKYNLTYDPSKLNVNFIDKCIYYTTQD